MKLSQINLYDEGSYLKGFGILGLEKKAPSEASSIFTTFISSTVGIMTLVGVIWFVYVVILGSVGIITSGGDKSSLENAKKKITNGLIGIIVIITGLILINFVGYIFGIPDILNIVNTITNISLK